jgi:hypothetical protein
MPVLPLWAFMACSRVNFTFLLLEYMVSQKSVPMSIKTKLPEMDKERNAYVMPTQGCRKWVRARVKLIFQALEQGRTS